MFCIVLFSFPFIIYLVGFLWNLGVDKSLYCVQFLQLCTLYIYICIEYDFTCMYFVREYDMT